VSADGATPGAVLSFWRDAGPAKWFAKDEAFDRELADRFTDAHFAAARRALDDWMDTPDGALALLILLDQVPRNLFRDSAHAYATDPLALHFATRMVEAGFDRRVEPALRAFCYLPFEHSESPADQERSVALFAPLEATYRDYAVAHRDVIARFGRFPHRNHALGRTSRPDEQAWLDAGGGF
jgi:uncharacterized protein (DUF924 family)